MPHARGSLVVLAISAAGALAPQPARPQANAMGAWSAPFHTREGATHTVLLRGQGDSTVVFYWDNTGGARVLLYDPANPAGSPQAHVPQPTPGVFEPGQVVLPDGRAFLPGGSIPGQLTTREVYTFDPKRYWMPGAGGWQKHDSMTTIRVAASAVPLADGSILVHSGVEHHSFASFGGNDGAGPLGELRELTSSRYARWPARPAPGTPAAREDGTSDWAFGRILLFGGLGTGGPLGDLNHLRLIQDDKGVRWTTTALGLTTTSPVIPPRSAHASLVQPGACDSLCDTLYVYGGLGAGGALGDVWRLVYGSVSQQRYRWEPVTTTGTGPGPRHGHAAVFDPGPPGSVIPRMLVFGGRDSLGQLADGAVWALTLRPPFRWSVLVPPGSGPGPRTGHRAYFDARARGTGVPQRMILFGGEDAGGALGDTWVLQRGHTNAGDTTYTWSPYALTSAPPAARSRPTLAYDNQRDVLVMFGGDGNGAAVPGGLLNDAFALTIFNGPSQPAQWRAVNADSLPTPRAGATMTFWRPTGVTTQVPERFDPAAPPGQQWHVMPWAQRFDQWAYPYLMLTDRGRIFYAGITDSCNTLEPDSLSPERGWGPKIGAGFSGASAVAVRPNVFMKSGGDQQPTSTGLIHFDSTGATTGWQIVSGMLARVDHNLLMLPTGDVLVVGGVALRRNQATAQRSPQIYSVADGTWGPALAPSPVIREYHSSSALLPDARVITWGSIGGLSPRDSAEIYSPPYLFADAAGTPAPRPEISAVQDTIGYAQTFGLCACQAPRLRSACLIRPASGTHAFDANARFVPLTFTADPSGTVFMVDAPQNPNLAPPGDYMLFVVDSSGVPSMAKWMHVRPGAAVPGVACPTPCATDAPPMVPLVLSLSRPRPNPSFARVAIAFTVPSRSHVRVELLDLQGRRIRRLTERVLEPGAHTVTWDGHGDEGRRVPAGVYYVRLTSAGETRVEKLVRLP